MNCCAARRSLLACVRSACASVARADSRLALRSATRLLSLGHVDAAQHLPGRAPGCLRPRVSASSVPPALARTTAVCGATSGPENSITARQPRQRRLHHLARLNSSATSGFLPPCRPGLGGGQPATSGQQRARHHRRQRPPAQPTPLDQPLLFMHAPAEHSTVPGRRRASLGERPAVAGRDATKRASARRSCRRERRHAALRPFPLRLRRSALAGTCAPSMIQRSSSSAVIGLLNR